MPTNRVSPSGLVIRVYIPNALNGTLSSPLPTLRTAIQPTVTVAGQQVPAFAVHASWYERGANVRDVVVYIRVQADKGIVAGQTVSVSFAAGAIVSDVAEGSTFSSAAATISVNNVSVAATPGGLPTPESFAVSKGISINRTRYVAATPVGTQDGTSPANAMSFSAAWAELRNSISDDLEVILVKSGDSDTSASAQDLSWISSSASLFVGVYGGNDRPNITFKSINCTQPACFAGLTMTANGTETSGSSLTLGMTGVVFECNLINPLRVTGAAFIRTMLPSVETVNLADRIYFFAANGITEAICEDTVFSGIGHISHTPYCIGCHTELIRCGWIGTETNALGRSMAASPGHVVLECYANNLANGLIAGVDNPERLPFSSVAIGQTAERGYIDISNTGPDIDVTPPAGTVFMYVTSGVGTNINGLIGYNEVHRYTRTSNVLRVFPNPQTPWNSASTARETATGWVSLHAGRSRNLILANTVVADFTAFPGRANDVSAMAIVSDVDNLEITRTIVANGPATPTRPTLRISGPKTNDGQANMLKTRIARNLWRNTNGGGLMWGDGTPDVPNRAGPAGGMIFKRNLISLGSTRDDHWFVALWPSQVQSVFSDENLYLGGSGSHRFTVQTQTNPETTTLAGYRSNTTSHGRTLDVNSEHNATAQSFVGADAKIAAYLSAYSFANLAALQTAMQSRPLAGYSATSHPEAIRRWTARACVPANRTNWGGLNPTSNYVGATNDQLVAPTGISATFTSDDRVRVKWTAASGVSEYLVFRSASSDMAGAVLVGIAYGTNMVVPSEPDAYYSVASGDGLSSSSLPTGVQAVEKPRSSQGIWFNIIVRSNGVNNTIIKTISVGSTYVPLSDTRLIGSVIVSCPSDNANVVYFRGDNDTDVPVEAGTSYSFVSIDLSRFFVKGTMGDSVNVIGGTW